MKASSITPSSPINLPIGSRRFANLHRRDISPALTFASTHIISPAGAATTTARRRTKNIFSLTVSPISFKSLGFLYGGSSRTNLLGIPLNTVKVSTFELKKVIASESITKHKRINADKMLFPQKNIEITAINNGNTPPTLRQLLRAFR